MITVVPAVLAADQLAFEKRIRALREHYTKVQIDVLNETLIEGVSFSDAEHIEKFMSGLMAEIHLMVDLEGYDLGQWNRSWVEKLIVHVEAGEQVHAALQRVKAWGKKVFIALNPDTSLDATDPYVQGIDGIMFMTVIPGNMGNAFRKDVLDKIVLMRKRNPIIDIEADGGVSPDTLPSLLSAGVTTVAVGSFLDTNDIEGKSLDLISAIEAYEIQDRKKRVKGKP